MKSNLQAPAYVSAACTLPYSFRAFEAYLSFPMGLSSRTYVPRNFGAGNPGDKTFFPKLLN